MYSSVPLLFVVMLYLFCKNIVIIYTNLSLLTLKSSSKYILNAHHHSLCLSSHLACLALLLVDSSGQKLLQWGKIIGRIKTAKIKLGIYLIFLIYIEHSK